MRLYLTPPGILSPLGKDREQVLKNLLQGQSALIKSEPLISGKSTFVGRVQAALPQLNDFPLQYQSRNNRLLLGAATQLKSTINEGKIKYGTNRIGIVLGTSTSGIANGETALTEHNASGEFPPGYRYEQHEIGNPARFLASALNLSGPCYTLSTACSSSGKVFASGKRLIDAGLCDAVILGGVDSLCGLTLNGFDCLESISEQICQPFSAGRDGINIGEAAALFVLTKTPQSIELLGVGEASDGYHISSPEPNGKGAELAIRQSLAQAELSPDNIGYINLHGTATHKNDAMESQLVNRVFGEQTCCTSTKPLTGHALGAAGAQELALCYLLLSRENVNKTLPAQLGDHQYDHSLEKINLLPTPTQWEKGTFMSNSFAFGGSNVSVIIGRAENERDQE